MRSLTKGNTFFYLETVSGDPLLKVTGDMGVDLVTTDRERRVWWSCSASERSYKLSYTLSIASALLYTSGPE